MSAIDGPRVDFNSTRGPIRKPYPRQVLRKLTDENTKANGVTIEAKKIRYAAGLTNYVIAKDRVTGHKTPRLRDNPGQVHAVVNNTRRPAMQEPFFVEETWDYRAALCGQLIRVVMPLSFKPTEENVCRRCVAKMELLANSELTRFERAKLEGSRFGWVPKRGRMRPVLPNVTVVCIPIVPDALESAVSG